MRHLASCDIQFAKSYGQKSPRYLMMNRVHQLAQHSLLLVLIFWLLQFASLYFDQPITHLDEDKDLKCVQDRINFTQVCRPWCPYGYYSLPGMNSCEPWLTCSEIEKGLKILEPWGEGAVKKVFKAQLRGYVVAYSKLRRKTYEEDFQHGLSMLRKLQPSAYVTQLLGYCDDSFITEYHSLGTAANMENLLNGVLAVHNDINTRFDLCINYIRVIKLLHTGPVGTRVMCDSNDLPKLLSQFLVNSDLTLVVNDLDALPEVGQGQGIRCGHRELFGDFVAPEQLWPFDDEPFRDELMPPYDEKTDVWKIPDVCNYFLGSSSDASFLHFHLHQIHKQCKQTDPRLRPSADEVLKHYRAVKSTLGL